MEELRPEGDVFLMTRFHSTTPAAYSELVEVVMSELDGYGLHLTRADWRQFQDELWSNVCHYMDNAQYGIAVFDNFENLPPSLNVSLELGYMIARGKRCLLLKEANLSILQADLAGHLCRDYDKNDVQGTVRDAVRAWLLDLGVSKRAGERLLYFVSTGGTCRDPMAKVILEQLVKQDPPPFPLRIEARALHPHGHGASRAARRAIEAAYGEDLLANHRPTLLASRHKQEADFILVMNGYLLKTLPADKSFVINQFFGLPGDISDPWPDGDDESTTERYADCLNDLRRILEANYSTLIGRLT